MRRPVVRRHCGHAVRRTRRTAQEVYRQAASFFRGDRALTGSGAETIAHLRQNGQITIMFCSFSHETKVLRLYGRGEVVLPGSGRWAELAGHFPRTADPAAELTSQRAIVVVHLQRIADSCGYAVPTMSPATERTVLDQWAARRTAADLAAYRAEKNAVSIDGLPALEQAPAP